MSKKTKTNMHETRKQLVDTIINNIETCGTMWNKEWDCSALSAYNPITGARYKGANRLHLALSAHIQGFTDKRWMTFKQAKAKGYSIKKGSKATRCEKWLQITVVDELTEKEKEIPFLNSFVLFNAEQIDGIPALDSKAQAPRDYSLADALIASSLCPVEEKATDTACYSPILDRIQLPHRVQFESLDGFISTLLHEMAHSTGHSSRLKRDLSPLCTREDYAREELIAELATVFIRADLGVDFTAKTKLRNHAAYLKSWVKVLSNDYKEFFKALKFADAAAALIMDGLAAQQNAKQAA